MVLRTTQTAVPTADRQSLVHGLNHALATAIDLHWQVKQAHWNLRGPWFFARHQLFDQLAENARTFADQLAERAGTLGGRARGTVRMSAERSVLPEYDVGLESGRAHLVQLIDRYGRWTRQLREMVALAQQVSEPATEDLLIEGLRQAEQDLWFLESHVDAGPAQVPQ